MSAKTQNATAKRKAAQSAPKSAAAILAPVDAKKLHSLVVADFKAMLGLGVAAGKEYGAFAALIEAAPLNNASAMIDLAGDIRSTYGAGHEDAAQIRINILNNAR